MKYLITLITLIYVVHFSGGSSREMKWNNYRPTRLRNWNHEVSVNGLFFSVNIADPMAFYSHDEDFCQLIIPMNSEVNDTNFSWTPTDSTPRRQVSCPEQESGNTWWIDPRNWESRDVTNATPHLERLPCSTDSVRFTQSNSLYVILPKNPVTVKEFYWGINGRISSWNLNSTAKSEQFLRNFVLTGEKDFWDMIKITGDNCGLNQSGCECGTMIHYKETCKILRNECNTTLPCENSVMPHGHCCKICGCTVLFDFNPEGFTYKFLEIVLQKHFQRRATVNYHVSRQSGNQVQIVIVNAEPKDNYDDITLAASQLVDLLNSKDKSMTSLTERIISPYFTCSHEPNSYASLTAVSRVMLPLFVIASLTILIVLLFQSKISLSKITDKFKSSLTFAKFENQSEIDEEQSQSQKQPDAESAEHAETSKNIEPELHSEGRSENGTSSELDDDSVLVELS